MNDQFKRSLLVETNTTMKFEQSDKHLKKLTSFYERLKEDGNVDAMEIELLKSYTSKFLHSISEGITPAEPVKAAPVKIETPPKPAPAVEKVKEVVAPVVESPKVTKAAAPVKASVGSSAFASLFTLSDGNELSDKLAKTSISDIGKSMSINEKIFTVKELFSGDRSSFDDAIEKLNSFKTYDEATNFLSTNVAEANDWLSPDKEKKVKTFLKLVQRKYV